MCDARVLVPIPDLLWEADAIFQFDPGHPEFGINERGERCLTLDACIAPAVQALWAAGVVTESCCCLHGAGKGVIVLPRAEPSCS